LFQTRFGKRKVDLKPVAAGATGEREKERERERERERWKKSEKDVPTFGMITISFSARKFFELHGEQKCGCTGHITFFFPSLSLSLSFSSGLSHTLAFRTSQLQGGRVSSTPDGFLMSAKISFTHPH
jgi:hypothetical protein